MWLAQVSGTLYVFAMEGFISVNAHCNATERRRRFKNCDLPKAHLSK